MFYSWYLFSKKKLFEWNNIALVKKFQDRISIYDSYNDIEISQLCWLPLADHLLFCQQTCFSEKCSEFFLYMSIGKASHCLCDFMVLCTKIIK